MLQQSQNEKLEYGKRKAGVKRAGFEAKEREIFVDEDKPSTTAPWLESSKLLLTLLGKAINPLNWKKIYQAIYWTWLKTTNQYEKLLGVWDAKSPEEPSVKIFVSLQKVDCLIQLGRHPEAMNSLKGLAAEIDACESDDAWKEEKHRKVKFYWKTIQGLAALPHKEAG